MNILLSYRTVLIVIFFPEWSPMSKPDGDRWPWCSFLAASLQQGKGKLSRRSRHASHSPGHTGYRDRSLMMIMVLCLCG